MSEAMNMTNQGIIDGVATENIDVTGFNSANVTWRANEGETISGYDVNVINNDANRGSKWYQTKQGAIGIGIASSIATTGIILGLQAFKRYDPFGWFGGNRSSKRNTYDADFTEVDEEDDEE